MEPVMELADQGGFAVPARAFDFASPQLASCLPAGTISGLDLNGSAG
jgi:hypothetical protein